MTRRKKSLSTTLINIVTLGFSALGITRKISRLFEYETHVALNTLLTLIILSVAAGIVLAATWIGLAAMLLFYFLSLNWSVIFSLFILVLIHLFLLLLCALLIHHKKKNVFFPLTRSQLRHLKQQVCALREEID